jgi:serine/threonine-protein kinase
VPSTEYVAALVAFYEGRLDAALQHLDAIRGGLAWFYEAPELRGDILFARARDLSNQGERERARIDFEAGRKAYSAAGAIGESVPAVYESLGELEYAAMQMELHGEGDVLPPFHGAVAATTHTLAIMPGQYDALVLEARAYRRLAEYQANRGSNVEDLLAKAIADSQRAVAGSPMRPEARLETSQIYWQWGKARCIHNQDPGEQLGKAVEASAGISPADRDAPYYDNLGLVFKVWADYEDLVGADARPNRGKAIDAYSRAIQINDKQSNVWINLGANYLGRASQPRANDPDGDLTQAVRAFDKARSINPRNLLLYYYEGQSYDLIARRERARGVDPGPDLARSLDVYNAGLVVNPRYQHFHNGIGIVLLAQASDAWDRGAAPEPILDQAQTAFEQAIAVAPDQGYGYGNVGVIHAQRAWFQRARGQDPGASVRAAVKSLILATERIPDYSGFWADLGKVHAILAEYDLEQGRDPRPSLAQAATAIHIALDKNPKDAQSQLYLGELRATWARLHARQGQGRAADFELAAQAFQKAIDLEPENQGYQVAFGHFYRRWAVFQRSTRHGPSPSLARGLELVNQVLAARPNWPDARILRASLLVLQAQGSVLAAERREQAASAARDFSSALAINPGLDKAWRAQAALAQQIAAAPR